MENKLNLLTSTWSRRNQWSTTWAQQCIAEKFYFVIYMHFASHSLNLVLSYASKLPAVRNWMGILNSAYNIFNTPKWQSLHATQKLTPTASASRFCTTKMDWTSCLCQCFCTASKSNMSSWHDKTTSSTAVQLLGAIRSLDFQVSLGVTSKIFVITLPISRILQTENLALSAALKIDGRFK